MTTQTFKSENWLWRPKVSWFLNAKINEVKGETANNTKFATTGSLTTAGNKIFSVSNSVKKV